MEVVSVRGSKLEILINPGQTQELGRAHGFNSSDKTISRRHVSFIYPSHGHDQETCLQFEVLGINPIYVYRNDELEVFRRFERGQMGSGDVFCVSAKNPIWYTLRKAGDGGRNSADDAFGSELAESLESGLGFNGVEDFQTMDVDISDINLVKEFGFVVMGHEFDSYPKRMVRDIKNWDWFLQEPGDDSEYEDDDTRVKVKLRGTRKRKKRDGNDDEDWTGENEDDKKLMNKSKKSQNPKYMTRSKDQYESRIAKGKSKIPLGKDDKHMHPEHTQDEDEDEGDETLGGFIVDDDELEEEEKELSDEVDEDEEEELEDEYGEDED